MTRGVRKLVVVMLLALAVIAVVWFWRGEDGEPDAANADTFHMRNGDIVKGVLRTAEIVVQAPYATLIVPKKLFISLIVEQDDTPLTTLFGRGGERYSGRLQTTEFVVDLIGGNELTVSAEQLNRVDLGGLGRLSAEGELRDAIALRNDDRFRVAVTQADLVVDTGYGVVNLNKGLINKVDFLGDRGRTVSVQLKSGDGLIHGTLQEARIGVRTRAGQTFDIDPGHIRLLALNGDLSAVESSSRASAATARVFRDKLSSGGLGPVMVEIPTGGFVMGSAEDEPGHKNDERLHEAVLSKPIAVAKFEVTFAEYDRFAEASGREKPDDEGWGRGERPVVNVSWLDALAYADWLSAQTGARYRLPSETEWEYFARAGARGRYWWGGEEPDKVAVCTGCGGWDQRQSAPVGTFAPNGFGLYDVLGNVWEWTCSRYSETYDGLESQCAENDAEGPRVIRGGSWINHPPMLRLAKRDIMIPGDKNEIVGFRLVREL